MYERLNCRIEGVAPLLMNAPTLADPLNPLSRRAKEITAKKDKKTDADIEELAWIDFLGSYYAGDDGEPIIPGELVEACIRDGAKATRKGKTALAGIISDGNWPLVFDGPKTAEELYSLPQFIDRRGVKISNKRVDRIRPRFNAWTLDFAVDYLPQVVNARDIAKWLETAGMQCGIGNYRPRFGRFLVTACEAAKVAA